MSRNVQLLTRPTRTALRATLDPAGSALLRHAEAAAREVGCELWLVGGAVRDLALGRPVHDLDLAFPGDPAPLVEAVRRRARRAEAETTTRFGTASVRLETPTGPARLDLATLRTESYVTPGALPDVRATDSIEADLARRDFSVNAMALGLVGARAGELVDPFEGFDDLAGRRLRVLHDRSFVDDATRLWRGARTAVLFDLEPEPVTARLIEEGARWLEHISGDRLWGEFAYSATRGRGGRTLLLLDAWGALRGVHPAWAVPDASRRVLQRRQSMTPERLAAVLLAPLPARAAILGRLNAPKEARTAVEQAARLLAASSTPDLTDLLPRLEGVGEDARAVSRWLQPEAQPPLQRALRRWERTKPHLAAEQLVALGVPRGPAIGRTLARLRRGRYLGTLRSAADARRAVRAALSGSEGTA